MGFVDSLRAKLPGAKQDDGKPTKKTAKEISAEAQKARKRGEPIPRGEGLGGRAPPEGYHPRVAANGTGRAAAGRRAGSQQCTYIRTQTHTQTETD